MKFKKTLASIILAGTIGLSGCDKKIPEDYIQGEVIERYGTLPGVLKSSGGFLNNESVKLGEPLYIIKVKTERGIYTIEVNNFDTADIWDGTKGPQTIYSVAVATEVGTKIRFPTKVYTRDTSGFSSGNIGKLDPDDIEIINKK